jgi:hypothetical protein
VHRSNQKVDEFKLSDSINISLKRSTVNEIIKILSKISNKKLARKHKINAPIGVQDEIQ